MGVVAMTETEFGDLLRRYRTAAGLTQEELAERAGLSTRGISDLERGARSCRAKTRCSCSCRRSLWRHWITLFSPLRPSARRRRLAQCATGSTRSCLCRRRHSSAARPTSKRREHCSCGRTPVF